MSQAHATVSVPQFKRPKDPADLIKAFDDYVDQIRLIFDLSEKLILRSIGKDKFFYFKKIFSINTYIYIVQYSRTKTSQKFHDHSILELLFFDVSDRFLLQNR